MQSASVEDVGGGRRGGLITLLIILFSFNHQLATD